MPNYDYDCLECGVFTAFRPMAEYRLPQTCPDCGKISERTFLDTPYLPILSAAKRRAHSVNERSAHEPRQSSQLDTSRSHGLSCSCCHGKKSAGTHQAPDGAKSFPAKRPWMISH
jgi:putative FmdB family regulatory protein